MTWFEAYCPSEGAAGYFFHTWKLADQWLYCNGRYSGVNWLIREVQR